MLWNQFARVVITFALLFLPMAAQQPQDAPTHVTLQGVVQTPDKTPVPGASVHIVEQITGKSWITWTDETGKFRLPELPAGKFHIDAAQIGFGSAGADVAPTTEKSDDIIMVLKIASAAEIAAANEATAAANATTNTAVAPVTPGTTPPATADTAKNQTTTPPATSGTTPPTGAKPADASKPTQTARGGGRNNQGAQGGGRGNNNGGGFKGVDVNGAGANADTTDVTGGGAAAGDASGLGNAASSDALLAIGTTAQGVQGGFPMGFPGGENGGGDINNPGGFPGGGGDSAIPGGVPGVGGAGAGGGRGAGGFGGGPGGGRGPGGGGPGGGRGRGGQGGGQPPWGVQNRIRQRINQVHYTLNETLLDSAFDARTWQANGQPQPKEPFNNNKFGGSVGGPLRIPHIYDGRDKTFVFLNVNIGHGQNANFLTGNVPTALEREGNFCSSSSTGGPIDLYNFQTSSPTNLSTPRTLLNSANPCALAGPINPTAAALLALVPMPNQTPTANSPNNFVLQTASPVDTQAINLRVNQTISPKLNFGVQYNINQNQTSGQGLFPVETSHTAGRAQVVNITFNQNISPRLINAIVVNFTRTRTDVVNGFSNGNVNEEQLLGIQGASPSPLNFGLPGVNLNSSNGGLSYSGFNETIPSLTRNQTWALTDTVTWTHAKHATHFGVTFRRVQLNSGRDPQPDGSFSFTGILTENFAPSTTTPGAFSPVANTGSPLADFELGLPAGTSVQFGDTFNYLRSRSFITYFTDDWKIMPRVTVTYGLRYELVLPATELFGHLSDLDVNPANFSLFQQVTSTNTVGPFSGTLPSSLVRPNYKNVAPRISVAWRVPGKIFDANNGRHALIVRAGYNIFDNSNAYTNIDTHLLNQAPFATNVANSVSVPTAPLSFATGLLPTQANFNSYAVNPDYRNPIVQIWNLSMESNITDGLFWQISYIGTRGDHLDVLSEPNVLNVANNALVAGGGVLGTIPQPSTFTYDSSGASSFYNALQARLQKRMRNGFTFTALYTYSKSYDNASSVGGSSQTVIQDFPNIAAERGLSAFDMRHQITGSSTYELPFGERKRFAHKGISAKILSSMRVSGSTTFHTGTPLQPYVLGELTAINSGANLETRPNILPGCNQNLLSGQVSLSEAFNTSCFAAPGATFLPSAGFPEIINPVQSPVGLAGNAGRDIVRGPSSMVVNMALAKTITLGRDAQKHLDLRWEVNNLANHPNWSSFGLAVGTRNFGEVLGAGSMRTMDAVLRLNF
jgi:trimeric autotransporter adhesin